MKELSEENRREITICKGEKKTVRIHTYVNDIDYKGFMLNRSECVGESDGKTARFVFISSLGADYFRIPEITVAGRMRRKTENEGFDIQKNHGYGLGHKYSRISITATKNYCQCMQIAHMINQLFELSSLFVPLLKGKLTVKHLWEWVVI